MVAKGLCRAGPLPGGRLCKCCHMLCLMLGLATGLIRLLGAKEMGNPASDPAAITPTAALPNAGTDALAVLLISPLTAAWDKASGSAPGDSLVKP